jgi:signal transduction histidine kinase
VKLLPDSLWGRLFLLLLGALLAAQLISATLHLRDRGKALMNASGFNSALRIAGLIQVLDPLPEDQRKSIVTALDLPPLRLQLRDRPQKLPDNSHASTRAELFHQMLHLRLGRERPVQVYIPAVSSGLGRLEDTETELLGKPETMQQLMGRHRAMMGMHTPASFGFVVQAELRGGQWITFTYSLPEELSDWPWDLLAALVVLLLAVVVVSFVAVRWMTRPLSQLAAAAHELGKDIQRAPLAENGPTEVRRAARAFNTMQARLSRFVEERTRILAAISHDLKTPITRMRLRLEQVSDSAVRDKFERDLTEMQALVQGSLDFMRGMALREKTQRLDINALLESLRDDAEDMGQLVSIQGKAVAPYLGKPLALKRCLVNLVENAIRYGREASVDVRDGEAELQIVIADRGPGLPDDALEKVFEPFYRIEASRNPETGGTGLGLSIARNIARGHGGELRLENSTEEGKGLRAVLTLPR